MALVSKKTGKPSYDMSEELVEDPNELVSKESGNPSGDMREELVTRKDYDEKHGRHWEHR